MGDLIQFPSRERSGKNVVFAVCLREADGSPGLALAYFLTLKEAFVWAITPTLAGAEIVVDDAEFTDEQYEECKGFIAERESAIQAMQSISNEELESINLIELEGPADLDLGTPRTDAQVIPFFTKSNDDNFDKEEDN